MGFPQLWRHLSVRMGPFLLHYLHLLMWLVVEFSAGDNFQGIHSPSHQPSRVH